MSVLKEKNNKILIIDDDKAQLKTLSDILEINNFMPLICSTEKDAVKIAKEQNIKVAILDLRLGETSGINVLNKLKKINPDIKVIINTGYATLDTAIDAVNLDAFAYIKKMGNVEQVINLVNKAFYEYYEKYNKELKKEVDAKTKRLIAANLKLKENLSEKLKLENEIKSLNKDLTERVYKRTEELEAAIKELESFSYTISHDLRAPLRHINSYIEILQEEMGGVLPENNIKQMQVVSNSAKRLGELIDSLLEFARKNKGEINYTKIDMKKIVESIIDDFKSEIKDRNIQWEIKELPTVCADHVLIRQVWENLISNALKYTIGKAKSIIIIGSDNANPDETIFFIKDNGIGFDMKYVGKLFGVFQRLHSSDAYSGIGIGLANVKRIVLRHGGRVWAEGELNKSAAFYFSLPKNAPAG